MLIFTRKQGESFLIGDNIEISVSEISGDRVRIAIDAPRDVKILRKELLEAVEANKESADSAATLSSIAGMAQKLKQKK